MLKRAWIFLLFPAPLLAAAATDSAQTMAMAITLPPIELKSNPLVHDYTLDNGLRLIVKEDHRAPVEVSQIWYKVGSSYEPTGITGLSHMLEHMMFKGTPSHPGKELSRIIAANGGKENAFTGRDYTVYFQQMEKSHLPVSFELEADRMRNLVLPRDEFLKEQKVVMEERRMRTDDDPEALTDEMFNAIAFINSPYHHPVIGWMDDIQSFNVDALRQWYETWYAPNNATVIVVGDVNPDDVLALAKKYFGPLKPTKIFPPRPSREIEQTGARHVTVRTPAELPFLMMGYPVPVLNTVPKDSAWEPYALEVLAGVLSSGESARLDKYLVREKQIAANVGAGYGLYSRLQDLFLLEGTPTKGHTVAELEQALHGQIKLLQEQPVTMQELSRIKAQVVANKVFERDSIFAQAEQIGGLVTVGLDWRLNDAYVDQISAITPEQIQKVAQKYLIDDHLTEGVLDPLPIDPNKPPVSNANALGGNNVR